MLTSDDVRLFIACFSTALITSGAMMLLYDAGAVFSVSGAFLTLICGLLAFAVSVLWSKGEGDV